MIQLISKIRSTSHMLCMCVFAFLIAAPQIASAIVIQGKTPAGTKITSQATLSYSIVGIAQAPLPSNVLTVLVDEIIQPVMTCQNTAGVPVNSPGVNDVLSYTLTNAGNGPQSFSLARANVPTAGYAPVFTPKNSVAYDPLNTSTGAIFLETNGVAGFQAGADAAYVPGTNDPSLLPNASQTIYVLSDTPVVPLNAKGDVALTATSRTAGAAGAAVGTRLPGVGANIGNGSGVALVATPGGAATAGGGVAPNQCSYVATNLIFTMNKIVLSTVDPLGGAVVMPGSTMTYQITVAVAGVGTATGVVVSDPMPANVTYVPGSITVGGVAQTDAVDADSAAFYAAAAAPVTTANTVYVTLGNLLAPSTTVITFKATVN